MARFILITLSIFLITQSCYSSEENPLRQKRRAFLPFFLNRPNPPPDPQYRLNIETGTYKRQETSDGHGNIKGRYTYWNEGGEHTVEYFAGQDSRFLSAAMTLPLTGGPIVPKYFFIPHHVYPCATNHTKEDQVEFTVEPLQTTSPSTGSTEDSTDPTTEDSNEATTGSSDTTTSSA